LLDEDNKAGLVLHEIIYQEALKYGQKDSRGSRYLNSYITSSKFEALTLAQYLERLKAVGIITYTYLPSRAVLLTGKPIEFYPSSRIKSAVLLTDRYPYPQVQKIKVGGDEHPFGASSDPGAEARLWFFEEGQVLKGYSSLLKTFVLPQGKVNSVGWGNWIGFHADGSLASLSQGQLKLQKQFIHFTSLEFYPSGKLYHGRYVDPVGITSFEPKPIKLKTLKGEKVFPSGTVLTFGEDELVIEE
jgi:hypothetical protein